MLPLSALHERSKRPYRILAVVVAYHPEPESFARVLAALAAEVDEILVLDNSPAASLVVPGRETPLHWQLMPANVGLGAAHNEGVRRARAGGFSHVLLMDQDSVPRAGMVVALVAAEKALLGRGMSVAAVGPQCFHPERRRYEPFLRQAGAGIRKISCADGQARVFPVLHLISSGCLIRMDVFEKVGLMDEDFFIDYVDIDWSFRAKKAGLSCFAVCDAVLDHHLGTVLSKDFGPGRRLFTVHSSLRHYYQFRNLLLLFRKGQAPMCWMIHHFFRHMLPRLVVHLFVLPPRWENFCMICRGLADGVRGKAGPYGGLRR